MSNVLLIISIPFNEKYIILLFCFNKFTHNETKNAVFPFAALDETLINSPFLNFSINLYDLLSKYADQSYIDELKEYYKTIQIDEIAPYLDCYFNLHDYTNYKDKESELNFEIEITKLILILDTDFVNNKLLKDFDITEFLNQEQKESIINELLELAYNQKINID